jgi:hypothetical protein
MFALRMLQRRLPFLAFTTTFPIQYVALTPTDICSPFVFRSSGRMIKRCSNMVRITLNIVPTYQCQHLVEPPTAFVRHLNLKGHPEPEHRLRFCSPKNPANWLLQLYGITTYQRRPNWLVVHAHTLFFIHSRTKSCAQFTWASP